jgi:hypothetical protein
MPMTRYRYARVSSRKQDVRGQVVQLRAAGVDEVRTEVGSGAGSRPVLDQLLDELVAGDVLVGTALDRLGRVGRSPIALVDDLTSRPRDSDKKAGARPARRRTRGADRAALARRLDRFRAGFVSWLRPGVAYFR